MMNWRGQARPATYDPPARVRLGRCRETRSQALIERMSNLFSLPSIAVRRGM